MLAVLMQKQISVGNANMVRKRRNRLGYSAEYSPGSLIQKCI